VTLARRIAPLAIAALSSAQARDARRLAHAVLRRLRGAPRRVAYFHQVDDPYGQLAAQTLPRLLARYAIDLEPHLVLAPSDAAAPERARLAEFARRDAADVAPGFGLGFPPAAPAPREAQVALAARVLARAIAGGRFAGDAAAVGAALWAGDAAALEAQSARLGAASEAATLDACAQGTALRAQRRHYLGATFHYAGEWYWGVDRLHHLERRLAAEGALRVGEAPDAWVAPRPRAGAAAPSGSASGVALEIFLSLRSPYSYLAMDRVLALCRRTGAALALRPVLPMVMRGLPVPAVKRRYILLDAKREADDAAVPFGRVSDPVGRPVERAFSLYPWACERGRAAEYLLAFLRAVWAEGVDAGSDEGLRGIVERAGLSFDEARPRLDAEGWRAELEANRVALAALGLWGVPSFCVRGPGSDPPYATWGQDRLWRVEEEIARRSRPA